MFNIDFGKAMPSATSKALLSKKTHKYHNKNIADKDLIASAKMYTILKYRIKSRDFYDVKHLIRDGYSFEQLLDLTKGHYPSFSPSEKLITSRFLRSDLNYDDEGFNNLILTENDDFESLRKYFKKLITKVNKDLTTTIQSLNLDNVVSESLKNQKYGLERNSLLIQLACIQKYDLVDILINQTSYDYNTKNIKDQTVFEYISDYNMIDKILYTINYVPIELANKYKINENVPGLKIIKKHKLINRCISKDEETINKILNSLSIDRSEQFNKNLKNKIEKLRV